MVGTSSVDTPLTDSVEIAARSRDLQADKVFFSQVRVEPRA